jgi:hypothetical protein
LINKKSNFAIREWVGVFINMRAIRLFLVKGFRPSKGFILNVPGMIPAAYITYGGMIDQYGINSQLVVRDGIRK